MLMTDRQIRLVEARLGGRKPSVIADGHWFHSGFFRRIPDERLQRPCSLALVGHAEIVGPGPVGAGEIVLLDYLEADKMGAWFLCELKQGSILRQCRHCDRQCRQKETSSSAH
jgi:hypothetical protein